MVLNIHYGHLGRSESIENFVKSQVEKIASRYKADNLHFEVWIEKNHAKLDGLAQDFCANIELRRPHKPSLFVKKTAENFYEAVAKGVDVINRKLRQEHIFKKTKRHLKKLFQA